MGDSGALPLDPAPHPLIIGLSSALMCVDPTIFDLALPLGEG